MFGDLYACEACIIFAIAVRVRTNIIAICEERIGIDVVMFLFSLFFTSISVEFASGIAKTASPIRNREVIIERSRKSPVSINRLLPFFCLKKYAPARSASESIVNIQLLSAFLVSDCQSGFMFEIFP